MVNRSRSSSKQARELELAGIEAPLSRAGKRARRRRVDMARRVAKSNENPKNFGTLSDDLAKKSLQAVLAAIEIYNKPTFSYREESFALLMVNSWELLLKAKWVLDHGEDEASLHILEKDKKTPKRNRSGNPLTHSVTYLSKKLIENRNSGIKKDCHNNILALLEIRDTSTHFLNRDIHLGRRILEIGTASLHNYLQLAKKWFSLDLSKYNFFLMPISFFHGFETVQPVSTSDYPEQIKKLLKFLDSLEQKKSEEDSGQHVALRLETKLVKGRSSSAVAFSWTDDPDAPKVTMREEDVLKNYPMTFHDLTAVMRKRYRNFVENSDFHKLKKKIRREKKYSIVRYLHPNNPKSQKKHFYNSNILQEFDKHYIRKKNS